MTFDSNSAQRNNYEHAPHAKEKTACLARLCRQANSQESSIKHICISLSQI